MSEKLKIEDVIQRDGMYISTPHGNSMWPLLYGKEDTICVKKALGSLKKYDVVLYKRKNGQYVLHRIIDIADEGYVMCGDAGVTPEYRIVQNQIIGVLDSFYRKNKFHSCSEKGYRFYVFLWCSSLKIRKILIKLYACYQKLLKKA